MTAKESAANLRSMEKRPFGKTGMQVSVLGFGAAEIGYEEASQSTVEQLLKSALDAGLNVIDTAECYRESEEMIGKAVGNRRADFYLSPSADIRTAQRARRIGRATRFSKASSAVCADYKLMCWTWSIFIAVRKRNYARAKPSRRCKLRATAAIPASLDTVATVMPRATRWNAARSIRCKFRSTSPTRKRSN